MKLRIVSGALCALSLTLLAGCDRKVVSNATATVNVTSPGMGEVAGIALSPAGPISLERKVVNGTCVAEQNFSAVVSVSGTVSDTGYDWTVEPVIGATVDQSGHFSSLGSTSTSEEDVFYVKATTHVGSKTASVKVVVTGRCGSGTPPPSGGSTLYSLSVDPTSANGVVGGSRQIDVYCRTNGANTPCSPSWESSNPDVVLVASGLMQYRSPGTALVCAIWQGERACVSVTVSAPTPTPAPTLSFTITPSSIGQGGTVHAVWDAQNAASCTKTGDWSGVVGPNGSTDLVLGETKDYTFYLTCMGPGGSIGPQLQLVHVTAPACPSSIDYTPKGGIYPKGSVVAASVDSWPSGVSCVPFWYTDHPETWQVLGGDEIVFINGSKYFAGVNGQFKAISVGTATNSVQTSVAINWVNRSYLFTSVLSSGLSALGLKMPDPILPRHNILTNPDVKQTPPWVK